MMIANRLNPLLSELQSKYQELSARERSLVAGGLSVMLFIGIFLAVESVSGFVQSRFAELEDMRKQVSRTAPILKQYQELKLRLDRLEENQLNRPAPKAGFRPYLENLARDAGIPTAEIRVTPLSGVLGRKLSRINLQFQSSNLKDATNFLQKLSSDPHALFIDQLSLRAVGSYRLTVELKLIAIEDKA